MMRFYCLHHPQEIRVLAIGTGRVWCQEGRHYLSHHFPGEPYWGHCYECKVVWFHTPEMLPRETCPACKRRLELSYLCHNCETFGYEQSAGDAVITLPDNDEIACGSCAADLSVARRHFCLTLGRHFRTAREKCPLCSAGFFPVAADELAAAAGSGAYQPMRLTGLDNDRATLVAPTSQGRRKVFFSLLAGPRGDAIVLPRNATRERIVQEARVFQRVFDWPPEWTGDLIIQRPAIFERDGNRWRLKEFGLLTGKAENVDAAAGPSESDLCAYAAERSEDEAVGDAGVHPAERTYGSEVVHVSGRTERIASFDLNDEQAVSSQQGEARGDGGAEQPPVKLSNPSSRRVAVGQSDRAAVAESGLNPARVAVAVSLVLVLALVAMYKWSQRETVVPQPTPTPAATAEPSPNMPVSTPEQGMVFIPGGTFKMGRNDGDNYERPAHEVTVEPFYIDKFEVTCEEYQLFVDKEKRPAPQGWRNGNYPPGSARLPVTGVSWRDAYAYAAWAGKRLPMEKEWEFAARGADGRLYPWGNEWKPEYVNAAGSGSGRPTEVGLRVGGAGPFGAFDMVGNVWEWTADSIHSYEGGNIPEDRLPARQRNSMKVLRGGCYLSNAQQATATYRRGWPEHGADYTQTGFRCAKSVEPQATRN